MCECVFASSRIIAATSKAAPENDEAKLEKNKNTKRKTSLIPHQVWDNQVAKFAAQALIVVKFSMKLQSIIYTLIGVKSSLAQSFFKFVC